MELFFNRYGESGPPLIILHGLLGASGNWHTLSRDRFSEQLDVFALDQRNHGRSPHTDEINYELMADDVVRFLDRHGMTKAHVLGHSMGGKTAMELALAHPERVDRLVVADMAPRGYRPQHRKLIRAMQRINPADYDSRSEVESDLEEDVPSWSIRQFLLKNLKYDGESYHWLANLDAIDRGYETLIKGIKNGRTFDGPALFVHGGKSNYVEASDREHIKRLFPNARFTEIAGAGHWIHAETPKPFADAVMHFLTK